MGEMPVGNIKPMGEVMLMEFLRLAMGWSVEDLATQAGQPCWLLYRVWSGRGAPEDDLLRAIARALSWDEDDRALLLAVIDGDAALERRRRLATDKLNEFLDASMGKGLRMKGVRDG